MAETNIHDNFTLDPIEIQAATLSGDVRDQILREFKTLPNVWPKLNEGQQQRLIERAVDIADHLVDAAIDIAASHAFEHFYVKLSNYSDNGDNIACKISMKSSEDAAAAAHRLLMADTVILVTCDPREFKGERAPAKPDNVTDLAMPHRERVNPETGEVTPSGEQVPESHMVHG